MAWIKEIVVDTSNHHLVYDIESRNQQHDTVLQIQGFRRDMDYGLETGKRE